MSCRVYSSPFFDSFESRVEIPPVSEIMQEVAQILNRVKIRSDQRPPTSSTSFGPKRWKGNFQASSTENDEGDNCVADEQEIPYETVSKKKTPSKQVFIRQRSDIVFEKKVSMPPSTIKDNKFTSNKTIQPRSSLKKSQKVQTEKDINIILNGITDTVYEPNAKRMEKLLCGLTIEEEKKSAEVYVLNTVVSLACKQFLYARSYALLLSKLEPVMNVKEDLEKLMSVKFELLTTLDTEKRMSKMSCKSFAVFYSFLVTTSMASLENAVAMLNELLSYYETYEDIGDLAVEFICTFLSSLKKNGESIFLQPFESLLSRLKPHFSKSSLSAMRMLDVKDCFCL